MGSQPAACSLSVVSCSNTSPSFATDTYNSHIFENMYIFLIHLLCRYIHTFLVLSLNISISFWSHFYMYPYQMPAVSTWHSNRPRKKVTNYLNPNQGTLADRDGWLQQYRDRTVKSTASNFTKKVIFSPSFLASLFFPSSLLETSDQRSSFALSLPSHIQLKRFSSSEHLFFFEHFSSLC